MEHVDARWPPLPLASWQATKDTLHRCAQIVGKVRMELVPPENHWWHVPLYVGARGLTTGEILADHAAFEIVLDLVGHRLAVRSSERDEVTFPLEGSSVKRFYDELLSSLSDLGVKVDILAQPYDLEDPLPFALDERHHTYDPRAAHRFFRALLVADHVLKVFRGRFRGKTSPVHLFWHSFDLATARYSGRPGLPPRGNVVEDEAYNEEVIAFGFWPGDATFPEPAFYSYTSPEPPALALEALEPDGAAWLLRESGSLAVLPYEAVRSRPSPEQAVLDFLESAYRAGAEKAGWPTGELAYEPPRTGRRPARHGPRPGVEASGY